MVAGSNLFLLLQKFRRSGPKMAKKQVTEHRQRLEGPGTSEVLPDGGSGMLLAGYARDCQAGPDVLSQRCINPHPGILPNVAHPATPPPPLIIVRARVERI